MSPKQTNMIQDSRISVASRERQQETGFQFFMGIDQNSTSGNHQTKKIA